MAETCELCGGAVEIRSSQEGTNHYVPVERGRVGEGEQVALRFQVARLEEVREQAESLAEVFREDDSDEQDCRICGIVGHDHCCVPLFLAALDALKEE